MPVLLKDSITSNSVVMIRVAIEIYPFWVDLELACRFAAAPHFSFFFFSWNLPLQQATRFGLSKAKLLITYKQIPRGFSLV